ncbi:heliorhodopsin HeR [Phycicoccus sp. BSK3Z-2]|uniref:Heliorhodopsin HeR n=1 Tax=Phycicoccus avicenniae TaxID=2828860 RepID=A0A941D8Y1_9MICO|nr:heliorhodopsin HeR [Phycicoccus avicenniae]MBR7743283.1 heliorhodopsin HeR [Phycicoccus avicenniae]
MTALPLDLDTRSVDVPERTARSLRLFNLVMGAVHLLSGGAMVVLSSDFTLPVSSFALMGPPGTPLEQGVVQGVLDVPLAWATASFLLLSAFFHALIASPWGFRRYVHELERGRNRFRWVEYALSSTLMIVLIALVTGITDLAALVGLGVANIAMILFGWLMEMSNNGLMHGRDARPVRGGRAWWTPFWFGCVAGIGPWLAIALYLWVTIGVNGGEGPPGFVWGIIVSLFVLFNTFAVNQWLQYRRVGRWRDYLFGERQYVVLSLVAKSVLAWQIFANTLIPS